MQDHNQDAASCGLEGSADLGDGEDAHHLEAVSGEESPHLGPELPSAVHLTGVDQTLLALEQNSLEEITVLEDCEEDELGAMEEQAFEFEYSDDIDLGGELQVFRDGPAREHTVDWYLQRQTEPVVPPLFSGPGIHVSSVLQASLHFTECCMRHNMR